MYTELVITRLSYSRAMPEVLCHVIHYLLYFPIECKHKNWQWRHKSENISRESDDKGVWCTVMWYLLPSALHHNAVAGCSKVLCRSNTQSCRES